LRAVGFTYCCGSEGEQPLDSGCADRPRHSGASGLVGKFIHADFRYVPAPRGRLGGGNWRFWRSYRRDAHSGIHRFPSPVDGKLCTGIRTRGVRISDCSGRDPRTRSEAGGHRTVILSTKPREGCRWDLIALGEVMLRFDPGDKRIWTTRKFNVYEGGGEYNVARSLKTCFGLESGVVTALVDNAVGRLVQDLIYQGGVDQSLIRWLPDDGVGRTARNGLNFVDRGFGVRGASGCSDRGHTAVSQLNAGEIDWEGIFAKQGARWFHTGGIFCGLSETTVEVAEEAMKAAKRHGVVVSYDLNYRDSLWKSIGGKTQAQKVNRRLAPLVDVLFGNEEDFTAALGFEVDGMDRHITQFEVADFKKMIQQVTKEFPFKIVGATLRSAKTATKNDWGGLWYGGGDFFEARNYDGLEIYDRIGGGDSFASGFIYGLLTGQSIQWAVNCGAAHGALAMTTPGDTSMVTLTEVLQVMEGASARI